MVRITPRQLISKPVMLFGLRCWKNQYRSAHIRYCILTTVEWLREINTRIPRLIKQFKTI